MRKMATVRKIDSISPIEGADSIELAKLGGWHTVVKKGEFKEGELAVYCEIDSWIPQSVAPFLTKPGKEPKEYLGIKGEKLKTIRLRGKLSQGLLLKNLMDGQEGDDVSELLGIVKWEPPVNAQLQGKPRGNFPSLVPKTDQERIQNMKWREIECKDYELTEKLEGSSCTFYLSQEGEFEVCSRNMSLKEEGGTSFWDMAKKCSVKDRMLSEGLLGFAIQGELIGPSIQSNIYKLNECDFYAFDVYDVKKGEYLVPVERRNVIKRLGLKHVPVLCESVTIISTEKALAAADGKSQLRGETDREGLVFKENSPNGTHFKAISNAYLLKN